MSEELHRRGKIVRVSPHLLANMVTEGQTTEGIRCVEGVPESATFVRAWYEPRWEVFCLLFVCPEWPEVQYGQEYPELRAWFQIQEVAA